jgi:histone-lysine N-methyltransferase SETMAR
MDKIEIRAVIKYFVLKGLTPTDIKNELDSTLKETAPSFSTVKKWAAEFKRGRTSIEDDERTGRPKTATTDEIVAKINNAVLNDRRLKVREIAEAVKISIDRVHHILHEILGMRKLSARWVPRLLTVAQKRVRMNISQECLDLFKRNPAEFLRRFITVDETWIHHYTPETKQQSKQWIGAGESVPKKAKTVPSAGKVMATVFWDSRGVVLIDYLQKGKTITGAYYSSLLDKLNEAIKAKRPHLAKKKVLFHHDNAPAHTSRIVTAKLEELRFERVPHAPYSPDLAPSDFFLFPNLKKWLGGRRFTSNEEVIAETNGYFAELEESYYCEGIKKLEHRWTKCTDLEGDYVEK